MAPVFFQKPETALRRAQELISVGKEGDALDTLHETIKSKRLKQWTKTHELIMLKHMELCVLQRKPHFAKDALFQYKTLTQQIAIKSLETVILKFLELAQAKTEEAQKTSHEKVEEIDDLDMADAPENLLLSAVSGADAQDRMDRTVLSPWLRFLWDSYRNCLDLLRNNAVVEQLYHRIARQSFEFCVKYQRKTEFRKLCDLLRLHLTLIQKNQHLAHVVKLTSAESLLLMQDTRLIQLDTAIQMELWQEAYRSAEDVHGMMQLSKDKDKRMVKPASYVNYYDKLSLVFWKAGNRLFHAAALLQKFIIYKDMKKMFTNEEATDQATRVLLATLSINDGADHASDLTRHLDIEEQHMANMRVLSSLLRLPIVPNREGILKEIARLNLPEIANENAKSLYCLLENSFKPLQLASLVNKELEKIEKLNRMEYNQYVNALHNVTASKILKQVATIYDTLSVDRIQKIIPFYDEKELERFFVDICKHRFIKARIDHQNNCIHFGSFDAFSGGDMDLESAGNYGDDAQIGIEGIRKILQTMHGNLRSLIHELDADELEMKAREQMKRLVEVYSYRRNINYERMLMRRKKIENYKETSERMKLEKTQQAQAEANKREEQRRAEEMKRLEQENIEKEKMRKLAEQEEIDRKIRAEKMKRIQATPIYHAIVKDHGEDAFHNMDPDSVLREQHDRMDEKRRERKAKLQQQEKKFDHTVRAFHQQEMIVRNELAENYMVNAPILHEEYENCRIQKAIDEHEKSKETYERMRMVKFDAMAFIEELKKNSEEEFKQKMADWTERLNKEKQKRLAIRHEERKKARRQKWLAERETEMKKAKEAAEQARREESEKERRAAREAQRPKREQVESAADLDTDWRRNMLQPSAKPTSIITQQKHLDERVVEGDRQRERVPLISQVPSAADSGPWVRGKPNEFTRQPERISTFASTREQPQPSAADTNVWRRGHVITGPKEPAVNPERRVGEITVITRNRALPTPVPQNDTGIWRRGLAVSRQGGDGSEETPNTLPANKPAPASQPWRPSVRMADGAAAPNGGIQPVREPDGGSSTLKNAPDADGGKWSQAPARGHSKQWTKTPQRREAFPAGAKKTADDDRNWRKK